MKLQRLRISDLIIIEPKSFEDERGWFYESWNKQRFAEHGLNFEVAQTNLSHSKHAVLRGLHYQWPHPQGKLVSVLEGEVWDVAVDIRRGSPTYGQWEAATLNDTNRKQMWIPEGFAHGFVVLSKHATFSYLVTSPRLASAETSIRWNDASLAINWPIHQPLLSEKDANAPFLEQLDTDRLPIYTP
jgi:dTDP-4-dehydrorhamnose 3,5-epimerase